METSIVKPKISSEGVDRISSLPDDVLHNILSHLFIFDVVQLSLLSKRWKYIWTTLPCLHFDIAKFYFQRVNCPCDWPMVEKFKYFINWVFISQSATKLVRFCLCCQNLFDKVAILRWIHAATRRNVQQLVLEFRLGEPFELPCCLVTCESLQVLKLHLSDGILKLPNHFGFRQLKLLHLERVELSDEHLTNCFISKFHLLENLILQDCSLGALTLLDIASTSLIYITLEIGYINEGSFANCVIKISCPNLKFLKYNAPIMKDIILENLSSIESVSIYWSEDIDSFEELGILVHKMIKEVTSTSVLKLCLPCLTGLSHAAGKVRLSPVSFHKLKFLELSVEVDEGLMQVMINLLKYSPNLEVLKLWSDENDGWNENWQLHDPDESIVCLESHLKSIELTGFQYERNEIELLRFFLKNARVLEKLTVVRENVADKSEEVEEEVLKFPRTSSNLVVTFLDPKHKPGFLNWCVKKHHICRQSSCTFEFSDLVSTIAPYSMLFRHLGFSTVEKFKDFINWVLISQSSLKLVRFILCCGNIFDKLVISRWIRATTRRNVQQLVLSFCLGEPFELPHCLVTCESLQVLKLRLFGDILKLHYHLGFRQLKFLHLEEVELSDKHLTSCLSKCHLLENLILEDCSFGTMTLLDIASTSLIYLALRDDSNYVESYANCEVKIRCPNLKLFNYHAPMVKDIIMENLFLIEAVSIFCTEVTGSYEEFGILLHKMFKQVSSTSVLKLCMPHLGSAPGGWQTKPWKRLINIGVS